MVILTEIKQRPASSTIVYRYDVFISFRGVDTGHTFTAHLHKAFLNANIIAVLDDDELQTEGDLKPELVSAIKASRASIIVLSKNYASSTRCLDELVLTLDQRRNFNHIVIPIFYHVDPTDVRNLVNSFGEAMEKHNQKIKAESNAEIKSQLGRKMKTWKKALTQVANIHGKDARGRLETEIIEEIVNDINTSIGVSLRRNLPLLIGMDYSINFISSWLEDGSSHTADILTIMGMNGIGKTSLAKYVYKLHHDLFDRSSFIADINRKCLEHSGNILDLQRQLYSDISEQQSKVQVYDVSVYTSKIEKALEDKEVLLVLDDVDSLVHLYALLGNKGFRPGSKIIITTKHASLTKSFKLHNSNTEPKHTLDTLKGLNEASSLQLFNFHAFKHLRPVDSGYKHVSEELAKLCQGHPLALNVLAKSLRDQDVAEWEEFVEELKQDTHSHIQKVLRKSFDSLPSKNFKELFLYIACFFIGMDSGYAETILKACGIRTLHGTRFLLDRSLLTISPRNELKMHQLLQDMGKDVVLQESPNKPWKRSRIWCHEESFNVMQQKKGKGNLKGMVLDMRMVEKTKSHVELETDALSNMNNLKLLQLNYVQLNGSYKNFPKELRWLCMHGFPSHSMPSDLSVENLVALDMSYSNLESFDMSYSNPHRLGKTPKLVGPSSKEKRLLGSLKILNLSFCDKLRSLGGFTELPALEKLIVSNCIVLTEVSESIEQCHELVILDMSYCYKLKKLPRALAKFKKVKTVLEGCNLGEHRPQMGKMDSMKMLNAKDSGITSPKLFSAQVSSAIVKAMPKCFKTFGISLPISLVTLSLSNNNLSNESFPNDFSSLSMLKSLYLDINPIDSLPDCVRSLSRLETLSICNCGMLKTKWGAQNPIVSNGIVVIEVSESIERCDELAILDMSFSYKLKKLRRTIAKLVKAELEGCILGEYPPQMGKMDSTKMLNAKDSGITSPTWFSAVVEAISRPRKCLELSSSSSLAELWRGNKLSRMSALRVLHLTDNSCRSWPNRFDSLPKLEIINLSLDSVELPPLGQLKLNSYSREDNFLRKKVFDPEMSPLKLSVPFRPSSFEIGGAIIIQPLEGVEGKVLHSLGWSNLEFLKERHLQTSRFFGGKFQNSPIQMYYEFGIFSTFYGDKVMPNWIRYRSKGSSISFTIPSSGNKLRGLIFCYVKTYPDQDSNLTLSNIVISNITKNHTWMYNHFIDSVYLAEKCLIFLSHWMFGKTEMEDGDQVTVTVREQPGQPSARECGINLWYDEEISEGEDVLGCYKSWNHIIGGDLSTFQTAGEYILDNRLLLKRTKWFGAISKKSNILCSPPERN